MVTPPDSRVLTSVGGCSLMRRALPALSLGPWKAGLDEHYTLVAGSFKEKRPWNSWRPVGRGARAGIRKINLHDEYFKLRWAAETRIILCEKVAGLPEMNTKAREGGNLLRGEGGRVEAELFWGSGPCWAAGLPSPPPQGPPPPHELVSPPPAPH